MEEKLKGTVWAIKDYNQEWKWLSELGGYSRPEEKSQENGQHILQKNYQM
jgi:hypothetical protein